MSLCKNHRRRRAACLLNCPLSEQGNIRWEAFQCPIPAQVPHGWPNRRYFITTSSYCCLNLRFTRNILSMACIRRDYLLQRHFFSLPKYPQRFVDVDIRFDGEDSAQCLDANSACKPSSYQPTEHRVLCNW